MGPAAQAQVAPSLLIAPWPQEPTLAQTTDQLSFIQRANVAQDGTDARVFVWDSTGRIKLDRDDPEPDVVIGYRFLNLDVNADRPDLNGTYNDLAVAGAFGLGSWNGWDVALIAGVGSANDNHWRHGDAFYGIGTVHLARTLAEDEWLHVGLSYDGNRAVLPDVPLPYLSYVNATRPDLVYVLGVPVSRVTWRPTPPLALSVSYAVPFDVAGSARYALSERLSLFAEVERTIDAFHEHDAMRDHQRLFYRRSTVAAGVRYLCGRTELVAGAGYVFNQEFSRGWDTRDTTGFADLSDEPMLLFQVRGTF